MIRHWREIKEIRSQSSGLHRTFDDKPITWEIYEGVLDFLIGFLRPKMRTLETGAGLSTLVFARCQTRHLAITPDSNEVQRILEACQKNNWPTAELDFDIGRSETALPLIKSDPEFDLVLIDGGHGFPTPFIDWFYSAGLLKTGGYLIIDDIQLPVVFSLYQFLCSHPHWRITKNYVWQSAVFQKISPHAGHCFEDWYTQTWLKKPQFPRWFAIYLWAPLTGNTIWQSQLFRFLNKMAIYYFLRPIFHRLLRPFYFHVFRKALFLSRSYSLKTRSYFMKIAYYHGIRKFYFHVVCPLYWRMSPLYWWMIRLVPIYLASYSRKLYAYTVTLIWTLQIPNLPGLLRMWFWQCVPVWIRRENIRGLFRKYCSKQSNSKPNPLLSKKISYEQGGNENHQPNRRGVPVGPIELWHVKLGGRRVKVHSVAPGDKTERNKDRGYNC